MKIVRQQNPLKVGRLVSILKEVNKSNPELKDYTIVIDVVKSDGTPVRIQLGSVVAAPEEKLIILKVN